MTWYRWVKFSGEILKETPEYIDLLADGGSEKRVRVFRDSYRRTEDGIEVFIGGHAEIREPNELEGGR